VDGTNVRVYRGRDYIQRLQRLGGKDVTEVDPQGLSDSYFVLEAAGRAGSTIRLVSALVRENQPFSSFVFFQNRATLGVSGAPRGLIHTNETLAFYFPQGQYVDGVSAVEGFEFEAGATRDNTFLRDANPTASPIVLENVDFADLKSKADLFVGQDGLDAEIHFAQNGKVQIKESTPPHFEMVDKSATYDQYVGWHMESYTVMEDVQVGTETVAYEEEVIDHYETETYWVWEQVRVGEEQETRYRDVQVQTGTQMVKKTRTEPVYEEQTVTKTRWVKVWVPYNVGDAGGGTSVGGSAGELGEYQWIQEEYETQVLVQVGTETIEYFVEEPVYQTVTEAYQVTVPIYEQQKVDKTRQVPVYKTVTKYREEPVYEKQEVEKETKVYDYETVTVHWEEEVWQAPHLVETTFVDLSDQNTGTMYVDGRVTRLDGTLNGRVTLVGNEKVRISGNIQYVDNQLDTAMDNGTDYYEAYIRNKDYDGHSVLGVIARDDVVFTHTMPSRAEVNGTLMSVNGRVGIDGFWADENGELHKDSSRNRKKYLTEEQQDKERAYDHIGDFKTKTFTKSSLRRIGGLISNNRVMETYIRARSDGTAYVNAGFKRGSMKFDINMLFNPPPNFVEIPRPVLTHFMPVFLVRNHDD
jgi:hypothetical protein